MTVPTTSRRSTRAKWRAGSRSPFSALKLRLGRERAEPAPQLAEVPTAVRDGDEATTRHEHAAELGEAAIEIGDVVEHPGRDRAVERLGLKRERLHVSDERVDAAGPRELDHPLGLVDGGDLGLARRFARRARPPRPTSSTRRGAIATASNASLGRAACLCGRRAANAIVGVLADEIGLLSAHQPLAATKLRARCAHERLAKSARGRRGARG